MKLFSIAAAAFLLAGSAFAQEVPDINDVYAAVDTSSARLGPTSQPDDAFEAFAERLAQSKLFRYSARIVEGDGLAATASVRLERGPSDALDRLRLIVSGKRPDGPLAATVTALGPAITVADSLDGTETSHETWEAAGIAGELVRLSSLSALPAKPVPGAVSLGIDRTVDPPTLTVHFIDSARQEHVYIAFDTVNALPRSIRRIRANPEGRPTVTTTTLTHPSPR